MNVALSSDFLNGLAKLPAPVAKKTREALFKFRQNPRNPGLNFEKLNAIKDKYIRSIRVDQDYRIILWSSPEGNNQILLWVDKHDEAYAWAENRRVEVNPEAGTLQVYQVNAQAPNASEDQAATSGGLFASLKDRELMKLGVPAELLPSVRGLDKDEDLERLEADLPGLAFQGLYLVAAGYSYEEALRELEKQEATTINAESDQLLRTSESRSQFLLLEEDQILEEMLEAPLEKWRTFLHPSQRALVERDWNGPVKVTGGPGTGKTVAALHRAKYLAASLTEKNQKVLFTTFTANLALDIRAYLSQICEPEILDRIEVQNIDALARMVLKKNKYPQTVMFESSPEIKALWHEALQEVNPSNQPGSFFREEWEQVVQPQQIKDLEAYKTADRTGRKVRIPRAQMAEIWSVFDAYFSLLRLRNWIESQDAFFAAAVLVQENPLFASVVVDETQDMGIPALSFLRALAPKQKNDLFLVGDAHQAIYGRKTVLSQAGIHVKGRSKKLYLNYRTTQQIGHWAVSYIQGISATDLDGGQDTLKGYRSLLSGPSPEDFRDSPPETVYAQIHSLLSSLSPEEWGRSCIAAPTKEEVLDWERSLLAWNIPCQTLDAATVLSPGEQTKVNLATIHRIKGLEFDTVLVKLPRSDHPQARALGFVGATRAKKRLVVF